MIVDGFGGVANAILVFLRTLVGFVAVNQTSIDSIKFLKLKEVFWLGSD